MGAVLGNHEKIIRGCSAGGIGPYLGMMILGIDIGGTGVKGGLVQLPHGVLKGDPVHVPTPHPASPAALTRAVKKLVVHFQWKGVVGAGFPG
ncbi:MAG: ROK family protein, partial [Proteobacteria bacterium]|nr:ROK family protein [Pseudomonadota bacterium]